MEKTSLLKIWVLALFKPWKLKPYILDDKSVQRPLLFGVAIWFISVCLLFFSAGILFESIPPSIIVSLALRWGLIVLAFLVVVSLLINPALIHLALFLIASKPKSIGITYRCIWYAQAPMVFTLPLIVVTLLAGIGDFWLPLFVISLWHWIISIIALNKAQGTKLGRAIFTTIGCELALSFVGTPIRTHVIEAFKIPSESSVPTLMVGDHIWATKYHYKFAEPKYGDMIVFRKPSLEEQLGKKTIPIFDEEYEMVGKDFISRIVGLPGDSVEMRQDILYINGKEVSRCSVGSISHTSRNYLTGDREDASTELWIERHGDNLYTIAEEPHGQQSSFGPIQVPDNQVFVLGDNRDNSNDSRYWGSVPIDNINGRVSYIWWSNRPPEGFRWDRVGRDIMGSPLLTAKQRAALDKCEKMR